VNQSLKDFLIQNKGSGKIIKRSHYNFVIDSIFIQLKQIICTTTLIKSKSRNDKLEKPCHMTRN